MDVTDARKLQGTVRVALVPVAWYRTHSDKHRPLNINQSTSGSVVLLMNHSLSSKGGRYAEI